ncbi:MAG TPA: FlgD immunoglobulin-like domain containing protein, partial [Candidatus Glassbacteria bacterium]|nr:FlgD immunoglobulin-like domain containing protein [Candidatus Glassbacteria bacterium]
VVFELPDGSGPVEVKLAVYDLRGRRVTTLLSGERGEGIYSLQWDGRDSSGRRVASGVYFLRLTAGEVTHVRKIVLLK